MKELLDKISSYDIFNLALGLIIIVLGGFGFKFDGVKVGSISGG